MSRPAKLLPTALLGITLVAAAVPEVRARDCRSETPLPEDLTLVAPGPEVPAEFAAFAGVWNGAWADPGDPEALCNSLVVEEVFANGFARIIYSYGSYLPWDIPSASYYRSVGRIEEGVLTFLSPWRNRLAYRRSDEGLSGTYNEGGEARLAKLESQDGLGCGGAVMATAPGSSRDQITAESLRDASFVPEGSVHNAFFQPVGEAGPALQEFEGRLVMGAGEARISYLGCPPQTVTTPQFTVDFFTAGDALAPVQRGVIQSAELSDTSTLIVSPGRIWAEAGDDGWSRAAFPFVTGRNRSNRVHNGLASFLFKGDAVSQVRFQIVQETAAWARRDSWGQVPLSYQPGPVPDRDALAARFAEEQAAAMEIRPWSDLAARLGPDLAEGFVGDWARRHVSAAGLVLDDVLYLQPCETRAGPFPDCRHMRHGVYSVTKSMAGAVSLLRLAQIYGPEVFDLKIKDYLDVTADHDGWEEVTFAHALSMAVGVGEKTPERDPPKISSQENSERFYKWLDAPTRSEKLRQAFAFPNYPWGPGEVARYDTTHTFVLAAAMEAFYKQKEGPEADLWDMVEREVLAPIGVFHAPLMRTVETDDSRGTPIFGYGFYPTMEEAAKIASLLQRDGRHDGRQLLHAAKLREALYRGPVEGLPTGYDNRFGAGRYHLSFWGQSYVSGEGCRFTIPNMSGYGGNLVALLPGDITVIRIADGWNYEIASMVRAADALADLCPAWSTRAAVADAPSLTASEIESALKGNTLYNETEGWHIYVSEDGEIFGGDEQGRLWQGRWRIDQRGRACTRYSTWNDGAENCYAVSRVPGGYQLANEERWSLFRLSVKPGSAEGY